MKCRSLRGVRLDTRVRKRMVKCVTYCVPSSFEPGGMKIGFHRQGSLLKNDDEFVVSDQGLAAISSFPHDRKDLYTKQCGGMDEYNRAATEEFVKETLPGLDAKNVIVLMRCLYQMSKDRQMLLGTLAEDEDIFVACGVSGGGVQPCSRDWCIHCGFSV